MSWFHLDAGFFEHPKTLRLSRLLKDERAGWYIAVLWGWLERQRHLGYFPHKQAVTGDAVTTDDVAEEIAQIVRYPHAPMALVRAFVGAGFVDAEKAGLQVHGWAERRENFYELRSRKAANAKAYRDRKRAQRQAGKPSPVTRHHVTGQEEEVGGGGKEKRGRHLQAVPHTPNSQKPPPAFPSSGTDDDLEGEGRLEVKPARAARHARVTGDAVAFAVPPDQLRQGKTAFVTGDWRALEPQADLQVGFFLGWWDAARTAVPELQPDKGPADLPDRWQAVTGDGYADTRLLWSAWKYLTEKPPTAVNAPGRPMAVFLRPKVYVPRIPKLVAQDDARRL